MSKGTIDISKFLVTQKKKLCEQQRLKIKKKMKLAAVETAATSCGKGVIGIKACNNDGKKKIGARSGKTISARRSGDDVGRSRTSDSNDR